MILFENNQRTLIIALVVRSVSTTGRIKPTWNHIYIITRNFDFISLPGHPSNPLLHLFLLLGMESHLWQKDTDMNVVKLSLSLKIKGKRYMKYTLKW